jgi:hypothetical protein
MGKTFVSSEQRLAGLSCFALLGLLCTGCPNPNLYGTPRTVAPGKVTHTVAVEGFGYRGKEGSVTNSGVVPTVPTYALRIGVVDRLDVGLRVANMSSLGADLKLNFLKSESFDMAVAPGGQWFTMSVSAGNSSSSVNVVYLHAPLVLGLNLSPDATLVATPGVSYAYASSNTSGDGTKAAATSDGVLGRFGIGFQYRITQGFAIHPEVTFMKHLGDNGYLLYLLGFGFNFGRIPTYGETEAPAKAPAAATAPAAEE